MELRRWKITSVMGFDIVIKHSHKLAKHPTWFSPEVHICLRSCSKHWHCLITNPNTLNSAASQFSTSTPSALIPRNCFYLCLIIIPAQQDKSITLYIASIVIVIKCYLEWAPHSLPCRSLCLSVHWPQILAECPPPSHHHIKLHQTSETDPVEQKISSEIHYIRRYNI